MQRIYLDGRLFPADQPLFTGANRAFRYGDGLFESIRMFEGKLPFLSWHFERLQRGMQILQLEHLGLTEQYLEDAIRLLIPQADNARIRVQVFRKGGGLYTPQSKQASLYIEYSGLEQARFNVEQAGIQVQFYPLPFLPPFALKTANALPYILAAQERERRQQDDLLLLNPGAELIEACASNVLVQLDGQLITSPYGLSGTMQAFLQHEIPLQLGIPVLERPLKKEAVLQAEALLLTNAIQGPRWIRQVDSTTFGQGCFKEVVHLLNQHLAHGAPEEPL
ncbi:MAG: aminotransferase class IV [Phaeodactylibacter sp.]|nr:aminotransferase class IV [Phaeodactylibacter sp.]